MTIKAWCITGDPDGLIERAIGPDEPDSEDFILVSLSYAACESYINDHGMLGWAKIVPLSLVEGHGGVGEAANVKVIRAPPAKAQVDLYDTESVTIDNEESS